jgi:hypothetical protein
MEENGGEAVVYSHFNYIPRNKFARAKAKKTLGYNETRKGKDGEEIERKLFGKHGPLTREQAELIIESASNKTYFFRWILSPDLNEENGEKDLDLWQLARDGVRWLEERLKRQGEIQLIGAEHNDHTGIPHIHAILLIERHGRQLILNQKDIDDFREVVHKLALEQRHNRQQGREIEAQMATQAPQRHHETPPQSRKALLGHQTVREPLLNIRPSQCMVCHSEKVVELLKAGEARCPACGRELNRKKEVALHL